MKEVFPKELFVPPLTNSEGRPIWKFEEEPLNARLLKMEAQAQESLRKALATDLTIDFIRSLHHKVTRRPPEDIRVEIKGSTRSGKSTIGIFLGKLISYYWGHEFTVDNILPDQSSFLKAAENAKYGETFLVDEQKQEMVGEGINREVGQLGMILNICAKSCLNIIFIYPPGFTSRGSPYGLETLAKDTNSKYVKCFYHDLRRKQFGYGGIWPQGYIQLPKYIEEDYQRLPMEKWSPARLKNFQEKHYDWDSLLEEQYEAKKDIWIEEVKKRNATYRMKSKEEVAEKLAIDDRFMSLKTNGQREAYILLMINRGEIFDMARTEIKTVADMAIVIGTEE
jgi:hypothetical protein